MLRVTIQNATTLSLRSAHLRLLLNRTPKGLPWRGLLTCLLVAVAAFAVPEAQAAVAYSWGLNQYGELGNGTSMPQSDSPVVVMDLSNGVNAVAAGYFHSLALQNGAVYAWGYNNTDQLGNDTVSQSNLPLAVAGLSSGVTAIAAGSQHSLAIKNGGVYIWGSGDYVTGESFTPVAVVGLSSGATAIAGGNFFSLAVQNGGVYAWGANGAGQLGNGTAGAPQETPAVVTSLSSGVTAIAAGLNHSLAIQNGGVVAWGYNDTGKLGDGTTIERNTPVAVTGLSRGVTSIAAGSYHSLAVRNGDVYAWGSNLSGELGDGTTNEDNTPELIDPADLHNILAVTAGADSSYALSSDGSLWVWGDNIAGQLGLGNEIDYMTPQHLLPPAGYIFTSVAADSEGDHAVATLAPVPEPGTLVLLAVGGLLLVVYRKTFSPFFSRYPT
ncbi:MAG: RCC1 domain-containing protein [Thermoguttaceae bacterium]